jgi:hypothetical protein
MQAPMIASSVRSIKPRVARPSAENRRFQKRNSQSVYAATSTKHPASPQPIENKQLHESEAVRRARDGDAIAFEYLYRLHSRRVYALCLRMVGDTTEAVDLTQEAFLLVFRKIHTFRGESASPLGCTDWQLISCRCICARSRYWQSRSKRLTIQTMKPARQTSILRPPTCSWRDRLTE